MLVHEHYTTAFSRLIMPQDSLEYRQKKQLFNKIITVFGRKPVLEILADPSLEIYRLHLAQSNKHAPILDTIIEHANSRGVEVVYHPRQALSRISKNGKQDQGVCIDVCSPNHQSYREFLANKPKQCTLLALDRITTPQNVGMIIRSVAAGYIDGLLIPEKGCAKLDSLVIKASAGTLFKAPVLRCESLQEALKDCQTQGAVVYGLSSYGTTVISDATTDTFSVYVLGNETEGISDSIMQLCDKTLSIPMNNGVESLNVAVTASLLAFRQLFIKP